MATHRNSRLLWGTLTLLAGAAGLGFGLGERLAAGSLDDRLTGELHQTQARIERLETHLQQVENRARGNLYADDRHHDASRKATDPLLASLQQRLDAVETELDAGPPGTATPDIDDSPAWSPDQQVAALAESQQPVPPHGVSADYQNESGESEWGAASAQGIQQAYQTDPYFARFGGSVSTTCKQQTCRIEWSLPALDTLSPSEKAELLATAQYQLMALASRNAADVGRMSTQWSGGDNQRRVAVVFARTAG